MCLYAIYLNFIFYQSIWQTPFQRTCNICLKVLKFVGKLENLSKDILKVSVSFCNTMQIKDVFLHNLFC